MPTVDNLDIKISVQVKKAEQSLDRLAKKLNTVSTQLNKLGAKSNKATGNMATTFDRTSRSVTRMNKSFGGLSSMIGKFYQRCFLAIRGVKALWNSIESTADYIEAYNYFDVALGKIGSDWKEQYAKYGYSSAEEYADSFATRLRQKLGGLSGLEIELDAEGNGILTGTNMKNLGLNIQEVTQYASQLASVTNSVGQTGETSLAAAEAFTKLGADMSSLFNMDYADVMKNLQSGLIGQSRALYKYGIDITNATLQTYAHSLSIDKAVSEMTQMEKMQLRMIAILDQSKVSWGDLANTINSPSNMIRQFKNNLKELSMVLGQLFIPLLQKVMPFLNGMTIAFKNLMTSIAGFFGIQLNMSEYGQGYNSLEEDADGATDAVDDLTDATKKLKSATLGIDELNILSPQEDTSSADAIGGSIDLTDEILKATEEYQKIWQDAFAQMENKAEKFAQKIEQKLDPIKKLFKDISLGDWFAVGEDTSNIVSGIFDFFSKAIDKVDWYSVGQKIGDVLAGINWTQVLMSVGRAIVKSLEAVIKTAFGMFDSAPLATSIISLAILPKVLKLITAGTIVTKMSKLGKAFDVLGTSFGVFMAGIKDKQALLGFQLGIQNIRSHLGLMQKSLIGVIAVFGEFFAVKDGFYDLKFGAENVIASIGKIAASAGVASLALYTSFGPAGIAVAALVGIVAAFKGVSDAHQALLDKFTETQQIEVFGEKLSEISARRQEFAESTREQIAESERYINEVGVAEALMAQDLANKYYDLYEKESLTTDEKAEMLRIAELLVNTIPSLADAYNQETGEINATKDAVYGLIEAHLQELQVKAAEDKLIEAYKTRFAAVEDLSSATTNLQDAQSKLTQLQTEYDNAVANRDALLAYQAISDYLQQGITNLSELQNKQELYNLLTSAGYDTTKDFKELHEELYGTLTNNGAEEIPILSTFVDGIDDAKYALDDWLETYEKVQQEFIDSKALYEEANKHIENLSRYVIGGASDAGQDYGQGYIEGIESKAEEVWNAGIQLAEDGIGGLQYGQDSHSPSKVTENLGKDFVDGYNLGVTKNQKSTIKVITNYVDAIKEKAFEMQESIVDSFASAFSNINTIVIHSFDSVLSGLEFVINNSLSALSDMVRQLNQMPGVDVRFTHTAIDIPSIPQLARGAVIAPNDPFIAMLGDQTSGRNIEAPESLIRQIVREETSGSIEMIELLTQIVTNTRETADKDFNVNIGDRDIYKANLRGARASGKAVIV